LARIPAEIERVHRDLLRVHLGIPRVIGVGVAAWIERAPEAAVDVHQRVHLANGAREDVFD